MIKAIPYMLQVKAFAMVNNLPFFTWKDMKQAIRLYHYFNYIL